MGYNWLTRSNRVMLSKLDAFAYDLHTFVSIGQPLSSQPAATPTAVLVPKHASAQSSAA
jgi:biopolymer transport protein ExbB